MVHSNVPCIPNKISSVGQKRCLKPEFVFVSLYLLKYISLGSFAFTERSHTIYNYILVGKKCFPRGFLPSIIKLGFDVKKLILDPDYRHAKY